MSSVIRPVGPEDPKVYWVRRLVVIAVAVVVVVLAAALISSVFGSDDGPEAPPAAEDVEPEPTDAPAPEVNAPCTAEQLRLTITTPRTHEAGAAVTFDVAIQNVSEVTCLVDAGEASRGILITSGSDRIWSNLDCPAEGTPARELLLAPGTEDRSQSTWQRVRSDETCRTDLPEPRPGTYRAAVSLNGATSDKEAVFDLG